VAQVVGGNRELCLPKYDEKMKKEGQSISHYTVTTLRAEIESIVERSARRPRKRKEGQGTKGARKIHLGGVALRQAVYSPEHTKEEFLSHTLFF